MANAPLLTLRNALPPLAAHTPQMYNFGQKVNVQSSSQSLLQALDDTKLSLPLGILVAQRQASLVFREDLAHLKLVSNLYDEVRRTPACCRARAPGRPPS